MASQCRKTDPREVCKCTYHSAKTKKSKQNLISYKDIDERESQ